MNADVQPSGGPREERLENQIVDDAAWASRSTTSTATRGMSSAGTAGTAPAGTCSVGVREWSRRPAITGKAAGAAASFELWSEVRGASSIGRTPVAATRHAMTTAQIQRIAIK